MTLNAVKRQCFSVSGDMFLCLSSVRSWCDCWCSSGSWSSGEPAGRSYVSNCHPSVLGSSGPRQRPHPELQTAMDRDVQRERAGQGRTNKHLKMKKSECIDMNEWCIYIVLYCVLLYTHTHTHTHTHTRSHTHTLTHTHTHTHTHTLTHTLSEV